MQAHYIIIFYLLTQYSHKAFLCLVDGVWSSWSDWDICPVTCGGDIQNRSRECVGPFYGGANCSSAWDEVRECGEIPCPGNKF